MLHQNQRVVDNPVYLCDLGASLSAAEPEELQKIMEEMDVSFLDFCFLFLIKNYPFPDSKAASTVPRTFEERARVVKAPAKDRQGS